MRVTIKDIAREAGVSTAAVSKALNGQPDIGETTRLRIIRISRELGYTPNMIARNLVTKGNKTIGVLIPDISTPIYPRIYKGINETAMKYGYTLLLGDTKRSIESEKKYIMTMMENRVAGLLVSPVSNDISHIVQVVRGQIPIIYFGGKVNDAMKNSIGIDNYHGAMLAIDYLTGLGHKDIIMICDDLDTKTRHDRVDGYREAMEKKGLKPLVVFNNEGLKGRQCGVSAIRHIIAGRTLPTAVFALNDLMAIGAMEALSEAGLRVPEAVSVMGYDDISFASLPMIGLSTIWQPKFKTGEMALELLHKKLQDDPVTEDRKIVLQPELRIRTSTCRI
ncbi:LacI family DNA-binding transcriptional regulator [Sediminispirochaeta bajacaliforniensis]|jgi:LacI family transcriptional regulator|uniref:LacI family DNA-binding transcriptional regulator n=1 Tax=Sediminispirochaeta bajacaliforniensis TaxID=148 RepID=UPI000371E29D|nr:LacI family DNA-binding transcriptional regulator [Sediminispirochaeta bajacaliforniensis]